MISWLHTYFVHCSWPHLATASYNSYDTQYGLQQFLNIHGQAWLPVWATVVQYYRPLHCNKIIKLFQTFGVPHWLDYIYIYCLKLVVWPNLVLIFNSAGTTSPQQLTQFSPLPNSSNPLSLKPEFPPTHPPRATRVFSPQSYINVMRWLLQKNTSPGKYVVIQ